MGVGCLLGTPEAASSGFSWLCLLWRSLPHLFAGRGKREHSRGEGMGNLYFTFSRQSALVCFMFPLTVLGTPGPEPLLLFIMENSKDYKVERMVQWILIPEPPGSPAIPSRTFLFHLCPPHPLSPDYFKTHTRHFCFMLSSLWASRILSVQRRISGFNFFSGCFPRFLHFPILSRRSRSTRYCHPGPGEGSVVSISCTLSSSCIWFRIQISGVCLHLLLVHLFPKLPKFDTIIFSFPWTWMVLLLRPKSLYWIFVGFQE